MPVILTSDSTLLDICRNAANACGFGSPVTIVGNTDKTARQLLTIANLECEFLSTQKDWQELRSEHTFQLVTSDQEYPLPDDFRWIIPGTTYDRDNDRIVLNPVSGQEWQYLKAWTSIGGLTRRARIRASQLEFEQTITAADNGKTIAFEYQSSYWAQSSAGSAKKRFTADTDIFRLDDDLMTMGIIWRFRRAKGLGYEDERAEYLAQLNIHKAADGGSRTLDMSSSILLNMTNPNIPDTGYGS